MRAKTIRLTMSLEAMDSTQKKMADVGTLEGMPQELGLV